MLERIKGALQAKEDIANLQAQAQAHQSALNALTENLDRLNEQTRQAREQQDAFLELHASVMQDLRESISEIQDIHLRYKEELKNFFVIKKELTSKVMQRFETELGEQLITHSEELRVKSENYRALKEQVERAAIDLTSLNKEVRKLKEISSSIHQADFQLAKYAKEVSKADKHKLELMQRIDTLERLVASLRRKNTREHPKSINKRHTF